MIWFHDDENEQQKEESDKAPKGITESMLESRTILISEPINSKLASRVISQLLVLADRDPEAPIKVFLNTPGGGADDGFAIMDMIRFVSCPVYTISAGLTASAGVIILLGAKKENRLSLPNSRIMIHQPSTGIQGTATDIHITAQEILKLRKRANQLIADETGQSLEKVEQDTERDYWLSPEEALEYGLIGRIVRNSAEI
ncbi:MAG: ATP-dependent Clp protease proteolytic subunit [Gemmatimonadetes bacterium]|nr:MAG: ATP-dependent Clp protease proteolytic subunit [Gemmatimonadota bacterium]